MTERERLASLFAAWQSGDALRASAHFASGGTYREARHDPIVGRDAIAAHFTTFFRDGPRWRFHPGDMVVETGRAAVRYRFEIARPDGAWNESEGCAFVTFADGTISEWREYEG